MKANRFIIHNPTIESYQLEEYYNHFKRMEEIDKEKMNIYKNIESNKSASNYRFLMLQQTSKFILDLFDLYSSPLYLVQQTTIIECSGSSSKSTVHNILHKLLDTKIERIKVRDNPYVNQTRLRGISQVDLKSPNISFNSSLENLNLMKKLQTLKPNISKKDLDCHYEKQKEYGSRLRKLPKLPDLDKKNHYFF